MIRHGQAEKFEERGSVNVSAIMIDGPETVQLTLNQQTFLQLPNVYKYASETLGIKN